MPNANKTTTESRIEIVNGVNVVTYNVYVLDDRFPENSILHKRLVAVFYDKYHAKKFENLLKQ